MILVVLNSQSNASSATKKWNNIQSQVQHDKVILLEDFLNAQPLLEAGDSILAAGGDGCLHSVVNAVYEKQGRGFLAEIAFGYIGLGSNNSFLQPITHKRKIESVPVQIGPHIIARDLIEVSFGNTKKLIVSNASFGFLAKANQTFNENSFVQILKKIDVTLADVFSFLLTLVKFNPIDVSIQADDHKTQTLRITNLHWLKSSYFTKDLHFKTKAEIDSGSFDFFHLTSHKRLTLLVRFSMLVAGKMKKGFDKHNVHKNLTLETSVQEPLEIDGEIYRGTHFIFTVLPGALKVLA